MKIIWKTFWWVVWDVAEFLGINLGKYGPWVLGQMIGSKPIKKERGS